MSQFPKTGKNLLQKCLGRQRDVKVHTRVAKAHQAYIPTTGCHAMPAVSAFLHEFSFTQKHLDTLLQKHPSHRGSQSQNTTALAACAWVRENEAAWGPWIVAARRPILTESDAGQSAGNGQKESEDTITGVLLFVLVIMLLLVAASVLVGCRYYFRLKRKTVELTKQNVELTRTYSADAELGLKPGGSPTQADSLSQLTRRDEAATWLIQFDELEIGPMLGRGGFGSVYRGRFRGCDVAIKSIHAQDLGIESMSSSGESSSVFSDDECPDSERIKLAASEDEIIDSRKSNVEERKHRFRGEIMLLSELRHPNCMMLLAACEHNSEYLLVTEYMKGSLADLLRSDPSAVEQMKDKLTILLDCAKGLCYLHHANPSILHCDFKPANLLLDEECRHCKLADFGMGTCTGSDGIVGVPW